MPSPPQAATEPPVAAKKEDKEKTGESSGSVSLSSIGLLVAPLIAALAGLALTGTIGRVQRDDPLGLSIAIGLVVASGAFWVLASNLTAPAAGAKRGTLDILLRVVSVVLAAAGFILALAVAVATANNEPRPQISANLSADRTSLTSHVTASNLPTNNRLAFRVDLLNGSNDQPLYRAYVGPNSDGDVDQTITTPLPASGYSEIGIKAYTGTTSPSCDDFSAVREDATIGSGTGCVIITLPPVDPDPHNSEGGNSERTRGD
jgi:hypothetical protein